MNYLNNSARWEEFFIQEAVELEEKMKTLDLEALNKSKIRICLESQILEWTQYEKWYTSKLGCCSLKEIVRNEEIEKFISEAHSLAESHALYDFWSEDLIPFSMWDNQLIIFGLQYNEKLVALEKHIFILVPPRILTYITLRLTKLKNITQSNPHHKLDLDEKSIASSDLEGINLNAPTPKISFNLTQPPEESFKFDVITPVITSVSPTPPVASPPPPASEPQTQTTSMFSLLTDVVDSIWEFISERHQEYSFEIKKQFDAFVVLKINHKKTQVFKMDADLSRQGINPVIFEYNLDLEGPFKNIFESGRSDKFSLQQLDIILADYQHACITPLKRGDKTVGFFLGFKKEPLSQKDQNLLDELAQETAS